MIVSEIQTAAPGDHVLIMRNSRFGGIHARLIGTLDATSA
jgi:hypothetical protein